jgi:hypothetical protein
MSALAFSQFQDSVTRTMPRRLGSQHAAILRDGFQLMVRLPSIAAVCTITVISGTIASGI